MDGSGKMERIVLVRLKEVLVVEVPVVVRLQPLDELQGRALGADWLKLMREGQIPRPPQPPEQAVQTSVGRRARPPPPPPPAHVWQSCGGQAGRGNEATRDAIGRGAKRPQGASAAEEPGGWHVAGKRGAERWRVAQRQQALAAQVWQKEQKLAKQQKRQEALHASKALKLQAWWRGLKVRRLAKQAGGAQPMEQLPAASNAYEALLAQGILEMEVDAASEMARMQDVAQEASEVALVMDGDHEVVQGAVQDEDMLLDLAILEAQKEQALMQANLQAIAGGASKALSSCDDGQGGAPKCPWGHPLEAGVVQAGARCSACRRKAVHPCVAFKCCKARCTFVSCGRQGGCAPGVLVKVLNALSIKYGKDTGLVHVWCDAG